jgi:carbamoyltransferase
MYILGLSAFYHDSAACLLRAGTIVAAAQEERFSRKKHDANFPRAAVEYCLAEAGIGFGDLELVAFFEKPLRKFERLLEGYLAHAPSGFNLFRLSAPVWIRHKLHIPRALDRGLDHAYRGRYVFSAHHEAHAASAFYPSPFDEAAIVTLDGVGEWATGSIAHGRGARIEMLRELHFPHSLGLLYSALTHYCGFKVNSGEYKLMGLAPYGKPRYRELILRELVALEPDGSFRLAMKYFAFDRADRMISPAFERLFGGPARDPKAEISDRELDLAASIQAVTEEIVLRIARHARALTGASNLVLAGGVALNCVANGRLQRAGVFERLWVQPAAGDAGGALGCALFAWHQLLEQPRTAAATDSMGGAFLGPSFSDDEVARTLHARGAAFHHEPDEARLCNRVAELLASGRVVGHFAGRAEFGPRALGNRSILADARRAEMPARLNASVKFRESFRPFAPAILRERAHLYFEWPRGLDGPYMAVVAPLHPDQRLPLSAAEEANPQLGAARSSVPAVTHVDYSARLQTVDSERHPRFHRILRAFEAQTGCPLLINTSLNVRGQPIVHTPAEAYECLMSTGLDALVLQNALLLREEQPQQNVAAPRLELD